MKTKKITHIIKPFFYSFAMILVSTGMLFKTPINYELNYFNQGMFITILIIGIILSIYGIKNIIKTLKNNNNSTNN